LLERVRRVLPQGGSLPFEDWRRRHSGILALLWFNVLGLPLYYIAGGASVVHAIDAAAAIGVFAVLAATPRLSPKLRSVSASLGLLSAAALLVDASGGRIEAHFYFFVLIIVLTLYEDWLPFLVAVAFVLVHHGVFGMLNPRSVFDRPEEWQDPWLWAGIHAAFVAAAGAAAIGAWRLNENVRAKMREAHRQLQNLSETDSLTGLGNRRKLMADLAAHLSKAQTAVLVLLDLDGFKAYNDTFGHPAGDSLLVRLGAHLRDASGRRGHAYRLGGDEFCVIWSADVSDRSLLEASTAAIMCEHGTGFSITAAYGSVTLPEEAPTVEAALRIADQRMYARKHSRRPSPDAQSRDVLLQALAERHPELGLHVDAVTAFAEAVARRLNLPDDVVGNVRTAAELHDIGKVAIPDAIINKPGPLDDDEWEFIRRHTVIGERILRAAPALTATATLVRSSHERFDGKGYPDALAGRDIPIGARIIAVCDAYDAMTVDRPYRLARDPADALAELRRCAGSQFDPDVVDAFTAELTDRQPGLLLEEVAGRAPAAVAEPFDYDLSHQHVHVHRHQPQEQ
jgi:diguanylate cyclase (GGDEF)-like protein